VGVRPSRRRAPTPSHCCCLSTPLAPALRSILCRAACPTPPHYCCLSPTARSYPRRLASYSRAPSPPHPHTRPHMHRATSVPSPRRCLIGRLPTHAPRHVCPPTPSLPDRATSMECTCYRRWRGGARSTTIPHQIDYGHAVNAVIQVFRAFQTSISSVSSGSCKSRYGMLHMLQ
jgi:hypothetical protein